MEIHEMKAQSEYFVGTCTHVADTPEILTRDEIDAGAKKRIFWLQEIQKQGSRVKVAILDGQPVGFIHLIPIELCPWGPIGEELMVIPCLAVMKKAMGRGVGRRLIREAEKEARRQGRKGIVTFGYYHDHWFMPAAFFEKHGFHVAERIGEEALLWQVFDSRAKAPTLLKQNYRFTPKLGRVVVDLFWNTFCPTSSIEAQRVRDVVGEYGDSVILNEYCADDRSTLLCFQLPRGIFVNGKQIWWGHEAPKSGISQAIVQALKEQ
jgi:GNAT superfamily N-acetyltransferase